MASPTDPAELMAAAVGGERRAVARLLSIIERGGAEARTVGSLAHDRAGTAFTVGITGAPGSGKSTLTSALLRVARRDVDAIGVLAIDPSSPFTGGAILGDRVRMQDHALDKGIFIRSMATRGHLGGLTLATPQAVRVLDAAGYGWILLETVGVGQVEVDVAGTADTTVVVVNPGWGDAVQANKAGLMEIADVFVINKADRDGVEATRRDLQSMLEMTDLGDWRPPIVATDAVNGTGVEELWDRVGEHRSQLEASGELEQRRGRRVRQELELIVSERLFSLARRGAGEDVMDRLTEAVAAHEVDPWTATDELVDAIRSAPTTAGDPPRRTG